MNRYFLCMFFFAAVLLFPDKAFSYCVPSVTTGTVCLTAADNTCPRLGETTIDGNQQHILQCLDDGTGTGTDRWTTGSISLNVPSGAIMSFNLSSCPTGWILANGSNGTPDLRGVFIRGLDLGRGIDPTGSRTLASLEQDAFQGHWHNLYDDAEYGMGGGGSSMDIDGGGGNNNYGSNVAVRDATTDGVNGVPRTASETRPINVALVYCQKQ